MKKTQQHSPARSQSSTRLGLLFCFFVFVLISIALLYKGVLLFKKSIYENTHRFSILVMDTSADQEIISVDPTQKKLTKLLVTSSHHTPISLEVGIPVDVTVMPSYQLHFSDSVSQQLSSLLSHFPQIKTRMTIIDMMRLYLLTKTIPHEDVAERTLTSFQLSDDDGAFLHEHFSDSEIAQEAKTIQILNASGVLGAGGTVEKMVNRVGGTVIAVNTARNEENRTRIQYSGEKTYTVEKLALLFQVPAEPTSEHTISDIIILLGKDHPLLIH